MKSVLAVLVVAAAILAACGRHEPVAPAGEEWNPLFEASTLPYGVPPFDRIRDEHFEPAFDRGMALERAEIDAIAGNPEPATFENTIAAMERSGRDIDRVRRVFFNLVGADTNDDRQAIQRTVAPLLAAHRDAIMLNPQLFARVQALYDQRDALGLDPESHRLLERYYVDFERSGAGLDEQQQDRLRDINARIATLGAEFSQRVLAEVNDSAVVVDTRDELDGLTAAQVEAAAEAAADRGLEGRYAITLRNTSGQPALAQLTSRAVRERVHRAALARGSRDSEHDTRAIVSEMVQLRSEQARLIGFEHFAAFSLAEQTAGGTGAVDEILRRLAPVAVANARREGADLQRMIDEAGDGPFELASWDWDFYAERLRRQRYDFEESAVRPYFELQSVLEHGVFHSANRLFGITVQRREDLPVYHPDVQVWEVFEEDGTPIGVMYGDFYARATKRGGAWMNSYAVRSGLLGGDPVVGNHLNIQKPPAGEPTLMTWDDVTTLFHEFGHVIHGLFSDVEYPRFAATAVPRDFVEYPSQVYEMWAEWPEVLEHYARHYDTGERIPQALLDRVLEARRFNEGFRSTEYLAAAITDQALHRLAPEAVPSTDTLLDFESQVLGEWGLDYPPVPPRYRLPYFSHIMGGYAAGYYSYIWSEVLDADTVQWFHEHGGLLRENGRRYRARILTRGGSMDAMEMYRDFAGRDPEPTHLLRRRGLLPR